MGLEGTDLEGYLAHHHDMIILTSIEESRQLAEQHLQNMQRRYVTYTSIFFTARQSFVFLFR